jgi:hypothetical protein
VPDEPGGGLEQVRIAPLEKSAPVLSGAGASPGALHDSGPTPASIARVSRDSITMRGGEARGGFLVFRRFNGLLLGRPLRRGHIASLGIHRRKGSHFRQEIGSEWDFHRRRRGIESAWQPWERALPRVMRERRRGSGLPISDDVCRSILGAVPDRSSPDRASPSRGPHYGHDPSPDGSGQPAPRSDDLCQVRGTALDFTLVLCSTPGFSRVKPGSFESCPRPGNAPRVIQDQSQIRADWHHPDGMVGPVVLRLLRPNRQPPILPVHVAPT